MKISTALRIDSSLRTKDGKLPKKLSKCQRALVVVAKAYRIQRTILAKIKVDQDTPATFLTDDSVQKG